MYVFYVSGKIPLEFKLGKEYSVGAGYIALSESEKDSVLLCCFIPNQKQIEKKEFKKNSHYIVDPKGRMRNVVVLCEVENMVQADKMVDDYSKAFDNYSDFMERANEETKSIIN